MNCIVPAHLHGEISGSPSLPFKWQILQIGKSGSVNRELATESCDTEPANVVLATSRVCTCKWWFVLLADVVGFRLQSWCNWGNRIDFLQRLSQLETVNCSSALGSIALAGAAELHRACAFNTCSTSIEWSTLDIGIEHLRSLINGFWMPITISFELSSWRDTACRRREWPLRFMSIAWAECEKAVISSSESNEKWSSLLLRLKLVLMLGLAVKHPPSDEQHPDEQWMPDGPGNEVPAKSDPTPEMAGESRTHWPDESDAELESVVVRLARWWWWRWWWSGVTSRFFSLALPSRSSWM